MCILPQITQMTQREMQQAALSRRERQLGQMKQTTITAVLTEIKFRNKGKFSLSHEQRKLAYYAMTRKLLQRRNFVQTNTESSLLVLC